MDGNGATLQDVVITHELLRRSCRPENPWLEKLALEEIAATTPEGPEAILHALCRVGLRLCEGGSCGINLLDGDEASRQFRWVVIEGEVKSYEGGTAPADHSPCGFVRDRKSAQLLRDSARYFEWIQAITIPIHESLIVPLYRDKDEFIGTMWVVSHDDRYRFDGEDVRILNLLSSHATAAIKLHASMYRTNLHLLDH